MRERPEIVKQLMEEEKLGRLSSSSISSFQIEEENVGYSKEEIHTFEKSNLKTDLQFIGEQYKTIFENYAVAITVADENEKIISWNKYAEELLNMNETDLSMAHVSLLYPPEEWTKIRKQNIRQEGMNYKFETKVIRKEKGPIDVEISLCILRGAKGKIVGSVGVIKDISKLKTTEKKLIESEEKYKTIFENSAVAITLTDKDEKIIQWNKYAEKLLGMNKGNLYLKSVRELYPPEEWAKIRRQNIRQKGMQHYLETKILRGNNDLMDVDMSLSVLKDNEGTIVGSIGVIKDISERKIAEHKLECERDLLQSLLDNVPDSIYFKDEKGRFIKVNKSKAVQLDTIPEEMVGKTDFDYLPKKEAERLFKEDKDLMSSEKSIINKIEKMKNFTGDVCWSSITKIPRYDAFGSIIGTIGISRDITDLKKADEHLILSEKKYRNLFEMAVDPILVLDKNGKFIDMNKQVTKLLGYSKTELIGKQFYKANIFDKESVTKTINSFNRRMSGEDVPPYEVKSITKNGRSIPAEINASPLYEGKDIVGDIVILRDMRERFKIENVEKELLESEMRFKDIFDSTSDFLIYLETGIILDANSAAMDIIGLKKEEIVGKSLSRIKRMFSDKNNGNHLEFIDKVTCGEVVRDYECELVKKNGTRYRFLFSSDLIKNKENTVGIIVRGRDITQRKRAWDELVKLEEKYRVLAETSADGVVTIDPLGRLTYVNPSFEKICGRRKSQILATLFREYLADESVYLFQQIFIDMRKNNKRVEEIELEIVGVNGNTIPIEINVAPLKKEGEFTGIICTARDITERKKVENELKKSERLKTEFMNIAAHELKSPVTPIKGYLELIISDKGANEKIKNWAKVSLRNSERLLVLVNDILDVSRLDTDTMRFDMEKLDPVELLNELAEDMKPAVEKKGLEFVVEIPKNLPSMMGDKYRLSQVLKNLMVNAIKFTDNGSISVKAKKQGKYIIVNVEDSGIGISKGEVKKVFTKFYQAYTGDDRKNEGTGLGLFICMEIVQKHNGDIWAESGIGRGSKFTIKLPHL